MDAPTWMKYMKEAPSLFNHSKDGFTLIEMLVAITIIGVLSAIAIPSWLGFINQQRLNAAQNKTLTVMRDAQVKAKVEKRRWDACFRDNGTQVLWAVSPVLNDTWNCSQATNWDSIIGGGSNNITIDTTNSTMKQNPSGYYRVRFRFDGVLDTKDGGANQLGRIAFSVRDINQGSKRCVFVSTLLGALRADKDDDCNL